MTEGEGFQGHSWTVQCEILEQQLLGGLPADEEPILVIQENGNPQMFDFFGLGHPGIRPQGNDHNGNMQGEDVEQIDQAPAANQALGEEVEQVDQAHAANLALVIPEANQALNVDLNNDVNEEGDWDAWVQQVHDHIQ
jgi:hypothetical protein